MLKRFVIFSITIFFVVNSITACSSGPPERLLESTFHYKDSVDNQVKAELTVMQFLGEFTKNGDGSWKNLFKDYWKYSVRHLGANMEFTFAWKPDSQNTLLTEIRVNGEKMPYEAMPMLVSKVVAEGEV